MRTRAAIPRPASGPARPRVRAAHQRGMRLVYDRFHGDSTWPVIGEIDHEEFLRTGEALSITALLAGARHNWSSNEGQTDGKVWITLRGIRAAIGERADEIDDTLRIVAHCVELYRKDRKAKLHRANVMALGMSPERCARFYLLMRYESFLFGNGAGDETSEWEMDIRPSIAHFADVKTIDELFATQKRVELLERSVQWRRSPGQIVPLRDVGAAEVNTDVLTTTIDSDLWEHVGDFVRLQKWPQLASQCAIFLDSTLRSWPAPSNESYVALAAKAFSPKNGRFVLGANPSEHEGWFRLASGVGAALRNVDAHRVQRREDAAQYAIGVLGVVSLLLAQTKRTYPDLVVVRRATRRRRAG